MSHGNRFAGWLDLFGPYKHEVGLVGMVVSLFWMVKSLVGILT